jgi:hypothetical protein
LCECEPERTGQVYVSLDLLAETTPSSQVGDGPSRTGDAAR